MDLRRSLALGRILAGVGGASVSWRGHRQSSKFLSPASERRSSSVQELPGVACGPGRGSSSWDVERELKDESSGGARRWRGCLSDEKEKDFLGLRVKYTLSCSTSARGTATYVFLFFLTEESARLLWSSRVNCTPETSAPLRSHGPSGGGVRGEGGGDSHTGDILPLEWGLEGARLQEGEPRDGGRSHRQSPPPRHSCHQPPAEESIVCFISSCALCRAPRWSRVTSLSTRGGGSASGREAHRPQQYRSTLAPATRDPAGDPYPRHAPRPVRRASITSRAMRSTTLTNVHNLCLIE